MAIEKWKPDDFIALSLVWGIIILILTGHDHFLIDLFGVINAGYFGVKEFRRHKAKGGK